jgi:hypothetical protein
MQSIKVLQRPWRILKDARRCRADYPSHSSEEEKPDGKSQHPNQDIVESLTLDHGGDPHSPIEGILALMQPKGKRVRASVPA